LPGFLYDLVEKAAGAAIIPVFIQEDKMKITRRIFINGLISAGAMPVVNAYAEGSSDQFFEDFFDNNQSKDFLKSRNKNYIPSQFRRQSVAYHGSEKPGTIVIDTGKRFLYLVGDDGQALRYGVGVGRAGFEWKGQAKILRKAKWPSWYPPARMRKRQPELPVFMKGGLSNPLGARALYLYQGGVDTLYRIHGTNQPWSIGKALSSGCVRLLNSDVEDLYTRVKMGATVKVL